MCACISAREYSLSANHHRKYTAAAPPQTRKNARQVHSQVADSGKSNSRMKKAGVQAEFAYTIIAISAKPENSKTNIRRRERINVITALMLRVVLAGIMSQVSVRVP